jgi:hypothetical protein
MQSNPRVIGILFVSLGILAGCAAPAMHHRDRPPPGVVYERDRLPPQARYEREGWEMLGRRNVDFRTDVDTIHVGRSEGRFRQLRVVVQGAPIELQDLKVTFGDGSVFDAPLRYRFYDPYSSRVIDLPGDYRVIRRVDLAARTLDRRDGNAVVALYGR